MPSGSEIDFKPYGDDNESIELMVKTYHRLSDGTHFGPRSRPCCSWIVYALRQIVNLVFLVLFFPFYFLLNAMYLTYYVISETLLVIRGFLMLRCQCCMNLDHWLNPDRLSKTTDQYKWPSVRTTKPSLEEGRRFNLYIMPLVVFSVTTSVCRWLCRYLAGLFEATLIEDEIIVLWVHLWGTAKSRFVYQYDADNNPIRVRGIIDDYTTVCNDEAVSLFFKPRTLEISSCFIDYDDDNRITFTLRNGNKVVQPRNGSEDEVRIWKIVKAHYQCLLSVFPAMIHTWVHFHLNDLTTSYIERQWKSGHSDCVDNVMDRIIHSHTMYTTVLNTAGANDGYFHPQTREFSWCLFFCAPWKSLPAPTEVIRILFSDDVASFWFKNPELEDIGADLDEQRGDERDLEVGNPQIDESVTAKLIQSEEFKVKSPLSMSKKTADPDAFPPNFVRNRLEMFEDEFPLKKKWTAMHRGYHIYKDFLADYYQVIHEEFTLKLHNAGYLRSEDLQRYVNCMEKEGFPGILQCQRDGGYLHILSTFLWLNVVHSSDHTVADNIVRDFGIGSSVVPMHSEQWYRENGDYDFVDVLEGKSCFERWRLQFYAMKSRVFWDTFGGPWNEGGFHADHLIDAHLHRHFVDVKGLAEHERKEINTIHCHYINMMKECDQKYDWLMKVEDFSAGIQY